MTIIIKEIIGTFLSLVVNGVFAMTEIGFCQRDYLEYLDVITLWLQNHRQRPVCVAVAHRADGGDDEPPAVSVEKLRKPALAYA